jgi:hypothetical protein
MPKNAFLTGMITSIIRVEFISLCSKFKIKLTEEEMYTFTAEYMDKVEQYQDDTFFIMGIELYDVIKRHRREIILGLCQSVSDNKAEILNKAPSLCDIIDTRCLIRFLFVKGLSTLKPIII